MRITECAVWDIESPMIDKWGPLGIKDIFCIAIKCMTAGKWEQTKVYTPQGVLVADGSLKDALDVLNSKPYIVGFNSVNFDGTVVENLGGNLTGQPIDLILYTRLMYNEAQLYSMDIAIPGMPKSLYGRQSLKAFGHRLAPDDSTNQKIEFEQFDKLTTEMMDYCIRDVDVTAQLFTHVFSSDRRPPASYMELEHKVASITRDVENFGMYIDVPAAKKLSQSLLLQRSAIERVINKVFHPLFLKDGKPKSTKKPMRHKVFSANPSFPKWTSYTPYRKPLKRFKSGKLRLPGKKAFKWFTAPQRTTYKYTNGEYQPIKLTKFKATDKQIIHWLHHLLSFEFGTFTKKGNIRVDRDLLNNLAKDLQNIVDNPSQQPLMTYAKDKLLSHPDPSTLISGISQLTKLMRVKKQLSQLSEAKSAASSPLLKVVREDGTITTRLNTAGTKTFRFTSSGGCLPISYKILTKEGPKYEYELTAEDIIVTFDTKTGLRTLSKLQGIHRYTSPVVNIIIGTTRFTCTPNHKWVTAENLLVETKNITKNTVIRL